MIREERPHGNERVYLLWLGMVLALLITVGQLARLQLGQQRAFTGYSRENAVRLVPLPAPRGVIYDRAHRILARNRPMFEVRVIPAALPEDKEAGLRVITRTLDLIKHPRPPLRTTPITMTVPISATGASDRATFIMEDADAIWQRVEEERLGAAYRSILIATRVPRDVALQLEELGPELPGVQVTVEPVREYPGGPLTAHILGYMGPIPSAQVNTYLEKGYRPDQKVGLAGIEAGYEDVLRGADGEREIVVDVRGNIVRTLGERPPVPGNNLILTIDLDLQRKVSDILRRHLEHVGARSGVVILEDVHTGAILSMVSLPTYDNNWFARGIDPEKYNALIQDIWRPLLNHAISGIYPPGSTFKLVTAAAALQEGIITPQTRILTEGELWLPNKYFPDDPTQAQRFVCWINKYGGKHGLINVEQALEVSCDIFFYIVGGGFEDFPGLGNDTLAYYAHQFGYGERTGIALPGEHPGLVPTSKWKRLNYAESWTTGDTYNMAIGQGFVLVTPLQVVNATAAVANGGILYRPRIVYQVVDADGYLVQDFQPEVIRRVPVEDRYLAVVREGMYRAVYGPRGTARPVALPGVTVAGKTGTAEFAADLDGDGRIDRDEEGNLPTHAWFTAFAPYEDPQVALVVFVFGGGEGSATAVPIAREVLAAYFGVTPSLIQEASPEGGD